MWSDFTCEVWENMEALIIHPAGFHKATEKGANWIQGVSNPAFQVGYRRYSFVEKFYIRKIFF